MRCLLDTCTFLWIIAGSRELSPTAANLFVDPTHEMLLSVVSVWEISVKHSLGKLALPTPLDRFISTQRELHGISVLPLDERAVFHLHKLPSLHRDPFDRMLICQAIEHDCVLLTPDPLIVEYPVRTQW
ncbi:MAG: type II toxin-antitoxin system VapC family toxin [Nitrospira sp.]|nr:type II toxin-antitoxin system VapC family toxin [Nitrospira sp.]MBK9948382.1 type II toxin-antitoxin system VapC family toxin [Nitrospira sp.]OYT20876.1 MAG: PIN domain nuclease [Nitrospira sp. UW-LDO-01]